MKKLSLLFSVIFCLAYLNIGCVDKIAEVETIYEEIFIETPIRFPDVHIYDEHYNEITDTLFINFDRDGIVRGDQKEINFSFTIVVKFDTLDYFTKIARIYFESNIGAYPWGNWRGFYSGHYYINDPQPYSILEPSDSVINTQNHFKSRAVNATIPINNTTLFRFDGYFYSTDSLNVFGRTKSFVIHNI